MSPVVLDSLSGVTEAASFSPSLPAGLAPLVFAAAAGALLALRTAVRRISTSKTTLGAHPDLDALAARAGILRLDVRVLRSAPENGVRARALLSLPWRATLLLDERLFAPKHREALLAVSAHELAHVRGAHGILLAAFLTATPPLIWVSSQWVQARLAAPWWLLAAGAFVLWSSAAVWLARTGEFEADARGAEWIGRRTYRRMLERFARAEAAGPKRSLVHPSFARRLRKLERGGPAPLASGALRALPLACAAGAAAAVVLELLGTLS